eukprot:1157230-Pelagomonas_calceolata.AAC.4
MMTSTSLSLGVWLPESGFPQDRHKVMHGKQPALLAYAASYSSVTTTVVVQRQVVSVFPSLRLSILLCSSVTVEWSNGWNLRVRMP